jgi:hypothetical protein
LINVSLPPTIQNFANANRVRMKCQGFSSLSREEISEVDVTVSYEDGIIFIEAKYLAPALVSLNTTHGSKETSAERLRKNCEDDQLVAE